MANTKSCGFMACIQGIHGIMVRAQSCTTLVPWSWPPALHRTSSQGQFNPALAASLERTPTFLATLTPWRLNATWSSPSHIHVCLPRCFLQELWPHCTLFGFSKLFFKILVEISKPSWLLHLKKVGPTPHPAAHLRSSHGPCPQQPLNAKVTDRPEKNTSLDSFVPAG